MLNIRHAILILQLIIRHVYAQDTPSYKGDGYEPAASDSYGLGVRLGVYFQTATYMLGFLHLQQIDVRGQLTGIIIGFQILIRWAIRMYYRELAPPESWVILAMLLMFTTPGIWLLALMFHSQRTTKKISRKEVVKGQGFNIILSVMTVFAVMIINLAWSLWLSQSSTYPTIGTNPIWLLKTMSVHSTWTRIALACQAFATLANLYPGSLYLYAWLLSFRDFFSRRMNKAKREKGSAYYQSRLGKLLQYRWNGLVWMLLFTGYAVLLGLSVEFTIIQADLRPVKDIIAPGQFVPMLTGSFALISALVAFVELYPEDDKIPLVPTSPPWIGSRAVSEYELLPRTYGGGR